MTTTTTTTTPKGKRRARNGTGSVYKNGHGVWIAQYATTATDANGRGIRVRGKGPTAAIAKERALKKLAEVESGVDTTMTVATFMEKWLATKTDVRATTMQLYRHFNKTHVVPNLGARKLTELTPLLLEETLAKMAANGASVDLRRKFVGFVRSALRRAVEWELMLKNPMNAVTKPRDGEKEMRFLTRPEIIRFLEVAKRDHLFAMYVLAIATGLRQGELFGLQVDDVDLARGRLTVRRSLAEIAGVLTLQQPKTKKSARRVDLDKQTIEVLRLHMEQHPTPVNGPGAGFVFTSLEGCPLRKSNVIRRSFSSALKAAKLGRVRFHDLRHTHASLLFAEVVHPKVVQERLGHASISMTMDKYSHLLPTMQEDAVLKLGAFFAVPATPRALETEVRAALPPSSSDAAVDVVP